LLVGTLRLQKQRKAPLVVETATVVLLARRRLDRHAVACTRPQKQVVAAVDQHPNGELVHGRRRDRRRVRDLNTRKRTGGRRTGECSRALQEIPPPQTITHCCLPRVTGASAARTCELHTPSATLCCGTSPVERRPAAQGHWRTDPRRHDDLCEPD